MNKLIFGAALAAALLPSSAAHACGGFFCNATNPVPILQSGERVVFAREGGTTTMLVEVSYSGPPTSFSWILPLPGPPLDKDGKALPLDQALKLSHPWVFDRIDQTTAPGFYVQSSFDWLTCDAYPQGIPEDAGPYAPQDAAASEDISEPGPPPVTVLQEAAVGPYQAQLLQATDSADLYDWLGKNGYLQDPKAEPALASYVEKGYVFLGLRLQNGKSTGDIRPISLRVGETAACVPLRLTGIAATPGMPIRVFVLGASRAIPKNHLHALVNPEALTWPGAGNYSYVVGQAVDMASGHAYVTESAMQASAIGKLVYKLPVQLGSATTLNEVMQAYLGAGLPNDAVWTAILRAEVKKPSIVTVSDDEFYANLSYWTQIMEVEVDIAKLLQRIVDEVVTPLTQAQDLIDGANVVTRLFTKIDPAEMTKDPIFAFNPDLPLVAAYNLVTTKVDQCTGDVYAAYGSGASGQKHVFKGAQGSPTIGPVPGAPALLEAQVLDESGAPVPVHLDQVAQIDQLLDLAEAGKPSLPPGTTVAPPDALPDDPGAWTELPSPPSSPGAETPVPHGGEPMDYPQSDAGTAGPVPSDVASGGVDTAAAVTTSGGSDCAAAPSGSSSWPLALLLLVGLAALRREETA